MPGYYVPYSKSPGVPSMEISVKVRVGDSYEKFFPFIRFCLENSAFSPIFLPFLFNLMRFIVMLHSCSHPPKIMIKELNLNVEYNNESCQNDYRKPVSGLKKYYRLQVLEPCYANFLTVKILHVNIHLRITLI